MDDVTKAMMNVLYGISDIPEKERRFIAYVISERGITAGIRAAFNCGKNFQKRNNIHDANEFFKEFTYPEKIIVNGRATIVYWEDGTKTVVKCMEGTTPDVYSGFTAALAKNIYGSNTQIKKFLKEKVEIQEKGRR